MTKKIKRLTVVAVFGKIHAVPLVSKFTGLLLSKADLLFYIPAGNITAGAQRLVHLWWMVQTEVPA